MTLEEIDAEAEAFIYDCDGTIADTMELHFEAWCEELGTHGFEFTRALFLELAGVPTEPTVEIINERYGLSLPAAEIADRRELRFFEKMGGLQPILPVLEHIRRNVGHKPLAVASGGKRESVHRILNALNLTKTFDAIVCAEDYTRGKPSPDPFLTAARKLGVAPMKCVVFEDAEAGLRAAEAAGMRWVHVSGNGRLSLQRGS